jgi:hypothetical protein
MTESIFRGQQLYIGDKYKVKYIRDGVWVPQEGDYGTFIGELRSVGGFLSKSNSNRDYRFENITNHKLPANTPLPDFNYVYKRPPFGLLFVHQIESMEHIEPDTVVYKPAIIPIKPTGGKRKSKKLRKGKKIRKSKRKY